MRRDIGKTRHAQFVDHGHTRAIRVQRGPLFEQLNGRIVRVDHYVRATPGREVYHVGTCAHAKMEMSEEMGLEKRALVTTVMIEFVARR